MVIVHIFASKIFQKLVTAFAIYDTLDFLIWDILGEVEYTHASDVDPFVINPWLDMLATIIALIIFASTPYFNFHSTFLRTMYSS